MGNIGTGGSSSGPSGGRLFNGYGDGGNCRQYSSANNGNAGCVIIQYYRITS